MVGIPVDSTESNGLRKGQLKKVICQISDLLIGRRYIKREYYAEVYVQGVRRLTMMVRFEGGTAKADPDLAVD